MSDEVEMRTLRGDLPAAAASYALPDRRELAVIAVERTRMPMVVTDPRQQDGPIVLANHAFLELTGYSAEEVIGRNCRFLQGPLTSDSEIASIRDGLTKKCNVSVELLNYRKDGSTFWNQLSISPVLDEAGDVIYHFGSQKDVTEQRRAQEMEHTERTLLMEVDHRALNALALVQSFVRLSRTDSTEQYAAAIQGRVDALARAHRLLAQNSWEGATIKQLIALETPPISTYRLDIDGPPTVIPATRVQPMALVLHELMSNALTHGALSDPIGKIFIRWHHLDARLVINWREHWAAHSRPKPEPQFGMKIIKGTIENQLRGATKFEWRNTGLETQLSI
ncbi:MAG: PAS domain-containing protein [Sphingobium sp.]|uniref:blue-light-activated histidine kinase n=1 Tax=Sphingobium sp. TaxID=1912891 RepID=UPI0029A823DA|nr:PAS domain-containing protein [Sphingobium sp.]MDX3910507.1 PAS domain-containing protein [Sphingobium sp.]